MVVLIVVAGPENARPLTFGPGRASRAGDRRSSGTVRVPGAEAVSWDVIQERRSAEGCRRSESPAGEWFEPGMVAWFATVLEEIRQARARLNGRTRG